MNYDRFIQEAKTKDCDILRDEPLSRHTTFRIGGTADWMVIPHTAQAAGELYTLLEREGLPWFPLGRGSNLLVGDGGYRGVVLKSANKYGRLSFDGEAVEVDAGVSLARLCYSAYQHGLSGLEFAWGIPGSVGGAAYMNAGAYDGEMKDVLSSVTFWEGGEEKTFSREECGFSYRHSYFSDRDCLITRVSLGLRAGEKGAIKEKMDDLLGRRYTKQPMEQPSAGSTFKRPQGSYASKLIDECGLRGFSVGGAQVSEKHCGFVVNADGATCADVLGLIAQVQRIVREKTGFSLEPEVRFLGEQ
ncbi:UDP-N-acetylmuramate dehydrogenase [bacterium 210820-DFI.6.52]|nr:UDP-N-acetylmuramate dehydrogenase [bacterium 210820-DFI.6.52]